MKYTKFYAVSFAILFCLQNAYLSAKSPADIKYPSVTDVPEPIFNLVHQEDRDAARTFYKKYLYVNGMPVDAIFCRRCSWSGAYEQLVNISKLNLKI